MRLSMFKGCFVVALVSGLAACGGGGSSGAGTPVVGPGAGTGTGTGGGTGTTVTAPRLTIALSSTTVTAASPARVTATLTTATGAPIPGQVVSFATRTGLGTFSAASALTDASGQATTNLVPSTTAASGADTVTVSYQNGDTVVASASAGFQLTATNVAISSFTSDVMSLSAYGQTSFTVSLSGTTPTAPVTVSLSSSCVAKNRASLTPATATVSTGQAVFTYRDLGCGATDSVDSIQASVVGTGAASSLQLTLASPSVSSIAFVSATPDTVYLKGTGLVENANVVFQVRDANGLGLPGKPVVFSSTSFAGGLLVDGLASNAALAASPKQTDANGNVTVRVNAGTVPTPVRITAMLSGVTPSISTVSSNLAVAVGLPSQNNFSLSQGTLNIEGYNIDGRPNTYTIIASDRLGNPVPAGTAVNFISESGQVQAIGFTTMSNGLASVTVNYQTSSPRPTDGRVTVLAYALGEESFLDRNGNNVYDAAEDYQDLGDIFLDRLFNGTYNANDDQFVSVTQLGPDVACNVATSPLLQLDNSSPSKVYTPTLVAINSCRAGWGGAYVRRAVQTVIATSSARPVYGSMLPNKAVADSTAACSIGRISLIRPVDESPYTPDDSPNRTNYYTFGSVGLYDLGKTGVLAFTASDANPYALNPMAAGTVISASATTGLSVSLAGGSPVPSTLSPSGVAINYAFDDTTSDGIASITFRSPGGLATTYTQVMFKGSSVPAGKVACP